MRICRRGHTFELLIAAFRKSSRSCSKPLWPQEHLNVFKLKGSGHRIAPVISTGFANKSVHETLLTDV